MFKVTDVTRDTVTKCASTSWNDPNKQMPFVKQHFLTAATNAGSLYTGIHKLSQHKKLSSLCLLIGAPVVRTWLVWQAVGSMPLPGQ